MARKISGNFTSFDPNNEIFNLLSKTNHLPMWWLKLLNDKDLYIEIRKDNYINVYYYGGCIAKIHYNSRSKKIEAQAHQKYMNCVQLTEKKNNYESCLSLLNSEDGIDKLKKSVKNIYLKENDNGENNKRGKKLSVLSEKKAQGEIILKNRDRYIDSEFAYRVNLDSLDTMRFDLVALEDGIINIIELKLISDSRLNGKNVEIIDQMKKYLDFISNNKKSLISYYNEVIQVKYRIGIRKDLPKILDININPFLLIVNNYSEITIGRKKRIEVIENILEKEEIKYKIDNYQI